MKLYEYKREQLRGLSEDSVMMLNELGQEGWRLASVEPWTGPTGNVWYLFEREIELNE